MSTLIKQFELAGVFTDVQFGKHLNYLSSSANSGALTVQASDNSTLANLFVAEPTLASHAATKNYVDNAVQGLSIKDSVSVATKANITLSGLQTIDTYTTVAGDRVLVKNQTDATQNGIYIAATGAWARSSDASTGTDLVGAFVFVENNGGTNSNTGWVMSSTPPINIGTTDINWTQFSGAGSYTAGAGLTLTGGSFSVNTDSVTTAIISNNVVVAGGTAGNTLISTGATEAAWGTLNLADNTNAVTGTLKVANGGLGVANPTAHGVLVGEGTSPVASLTVGTNYQVLIGNTGADPSFGSIDLSQSAAVGSSILKLANGGTNADLTAVAGAVTYSTSSALALSAAGTVGQVLLSGGTGSPTWADIDTIAITTGANEGAGFYIFDSGNSSVDTLTFATLTSTDSSINFTQNADTLDLSVNAGDIDINTLKGYPLTVAHGGTGLSSIAANQILYSSATNVLSQATITALALTLLGDATTGTMQSTLGLVIGTNVEAWSARLDGLAVLNSTGLMVQTGSATYTDVSIVADSTAGLNGLHVTNGSGVAGSPTIGLDISALTPAGSATDSMAFPVYNGTTNVSVTMAEIAAKTLADYPEDPLFVQSLAVTNSATSVNLGNVNALPAYSADNAFVTRVAVTVVTPFTSGIDLQILDAATNVLADTNTVDLQTAGTYIIMLSGMDYANSTGVAVASFTSADSSGSMNVQINYNIAY